MEAEASAALVRLLRQDELPPPLCDITQKYLLTLARQGRLAPIQPIRVLAHAAPLFDEAQVREFFEVRLREARESVR